MQNLLSALMPRLESHRLEGLNGGTNVIYPRYQDQSLVNIPSSICHWLGVPGFGSPPLVSDILDSVGEAYQNVVLLLMDGMGLNMLQQVLQWAGQDPDFAVWGELAEQATLAPLTSIAPSTTSSALTTFWTGLPPAAHGIMGYEMWLKEYGLIANMILHSPASYVGEIGSLRRAGFTPENFLPVPTLGPHLVHHGIQVHAYQHSQIARSGLSTMLMQSVSIHAYRSLSDLFVTLNDQLSSNGKAYHYIYWGDLDEHSHRFGPDDPRVMLEFAAFSRQLGHFIRERARSRARQDTLLVITADHGHIATPRVPQYELRNHPALMDMLVMLPSGESRLALTFLRPGQDENFVKYVQETWPGDFLPMPAEQVIQSGLFGYGPYHPQLRDRCGDYVVITQGSAYWWFANRDNPLLGRHGGISRTEMLVPLLAVPL